MEIINIKIIQAILDDQIWEKKSGGEKRIEFATKHGIRVEDVPDFKFPRYNVPEMRKSLSDVIDEGFEAILAQYRQTLSEPDILRHNNSIESTGRHISPRIVSITDVVAVNLVCDVNGSYSASDNSTIAQQGFILYSFMPKDPPGFLIVHEPINPVYLRCHNPWLSTIHFKLTDESEHLLDIRGEKISINLLVKSKRIFSPERTFIVKRFSS